ncbi:hypothetical protein H6P81_002506 [Aristolochia fimbriata]|uniref:Uncharacterized protein n=1 Tax=Aristolochia fimbriata TaxID=158543 RepID=A0AAV7FEI6_ARIFI|nr:hypothetical protein H6P81_002506 [Aristolochia fimbriata]
MKGSWVKGLCSNLTDCWRTLGNGYEEVPTSIPGRENVVKVRRRPGVGVVAWKEKRESSDQKERREQRGDKKVGNKEKGSQAETTEERGRDAL